MARVTSEFEVEGSLLFTGPPSSVDIRHLALPRCVSWCFWRLTGDLVSGIEVQRYRGVAGGCKRGVRFPSSCFTTRVDTPKPSSTQPCSPHGPVRPLHPKPIQLHSSKPKTF